LTYKVEQKVTFKVRDKTYIAYILSAFGKNDVGHVLMCGEESAIKDYEDNWQEIMDSGEIQTATSTMIAPDSIFPDANLEMAVKEALNKSRFEEITIDELASLTKLEKERYGITDLAGLEYCTNLTHLDFKYNKISDISPLSSLNNLKILRLFGNEISDIAPLSALLNLTILDISLNQISDVSPLVGLTNLKSLHINFNQISDISTLVENSGLGEGDAVFIGWNNIDVTEGSEDMQNIKTLQNRGVRVEYEPQSTPPTTTTTTTPSATTPPTTTTTTTSSTTTLPTTTVLTTTQTSTPN